MRTKGEIVVSGGFWSETGKRPDNQDFGGIHLGTATDRARHGVLAAIADGVSGGEGGRMASELAVRALIEGYYSFPETIGPALAIQRSMASYNSWLHAQGKSPGMANASTTFTAFALRGRRAHIAHVGDSRAWRFADGRLTLLTSDHVRPEPDLNHVLIRGLGLEQSLRLDQNVIEIAEHDRLLLTTDGVHASLSDTRIAAILAQRGSAEIDAKTLVEEALKAGSHDNASALVIDIIQLPPADHNSIADSLSALPVVAVPEIDETIDGFRNKRVLSKGRYAVLLVAEDGDGGPEVILKFPRKAMLSESAMRLAFTRELLIAQHVKSPFVGSAYPIATERQTALYGIQPYYRGETMAERRKRGNAPLDEAIKYAIALTRAVAALHRLEIIHRDIKPDNVILTTDGGLKLIDLGVALLPRVDDFAPDEIPGTPGFLAPEQFAGQSGSEKTDQFALGVTLYHFLTGQWPYGEIEAFQRPRFNIAPPPSRYRGEIPSWFDQAILTAIAIKPEDRFSDVIELLRALEGGGAVERIEVKKFVPLLARDPVRIWQTIAALLAIALIASLALR